VRLPAILRIVPVFALIWGGLAVVVPATAQAAALDAMLVATVDTSSWARPSPDPSGITYDPTTNQLIISDGEVEETGVYAGTNLFVSTLGGQQSAAFPGGTSLPWSDEPTGVGYRPSNGRLYVSDDDADRIFEVVAGTDGRYGTPDDSVTSFSTRPNSGDAEDVTIDMDVANNGHLLVMDGVAKDILEYAPGANGRFDGLPPAGDDTVRALDVGQYGAGDPEGIEYYPGRNTILVLDDASRTVYELNRQGGLLNTISISAASPRKAAGITLAPASNGSGAQNLYIVDRGVDNDSNPNENDGRFYEMAVTLPPIPVGSNTAPTVAAGPDQTVTLPASATLNGSITDDGLPDPPGTVTATWSAVSGPGTVTFGNPNAPATTASFSAVGSYVLRLTGDDGNLQRSDDLSVVVGSGGGGGGTGVLDVPVRAGTDDAEQRSASTNLTSGDLDLVLDGSTVQTVGMRFTGVTVPRGAAITNAYVQFEVDEVTTGPANLTFQAQAADNPPGFTTASGNISARPRTTAAVGWIPPAWPTARARGLDQRSPDLATVIQEIVSRPNWGSGNAVVLILTGSGTRLAEAFEGGAARAPVLHIEFGTGTGPVNTAPVVDGGPDVAVTMPDAADLAGSVTDDGLPSPPATATASWSKVTGPGTVTFADATVAATTATFNAPGTYVLRLTGDDSVLSANDDVTVTVAEEGTPPVNAAPLVDAGPDVAVTRPAAASLAGSVSDDGLPAGAVTATWSKVSGPGNVAFADAQAPATTATFTTAGPYVLRLTADDGELSAADDVSVTVADPTVPAEILEVPVRASADDAEERTSNRSVNLSSGDLNLGTDEGRLQTAAMRFTGLDIPDGATLTAAWVQFQADEVSTGAANITVTGAAADTVGPFTTAVGSLSELPPCVASVNWTPADWPTVGARTAAQRTPDLAAVVQEIVGRAGWVSGNSVVLLVTGTGTRVAESFDGGAAKAPVLHIEYSV
jgi:hypothetical protein